MKKIAALSVLLLGAAIAGPRQNNVIVGASQEPTDVLNWWSTNNLAISTEVNGYLSDSLIYKDDNGKVTASLATRVPSVANGDIKITRSGGKVTSNSVTYTIRPDAKWSDGTPITVADFQFWLEVQNDPRVPVPSRDPYDRSTITKLSDKKFTITYDKGGYIFADQVSPGYAPAHTEKAAWDAFQAATAKLDQKTQAKEINDQWQQFIARFTTANNLPTVSSGPFRLTSWRPGSSMTMDRNPNYWRTPTGGVNKYAKQIIYRFIPDTNTLRVNVLSGQIDALSPTGITFDQALELQKTERGRYKTYFVPSGTWEHIDINKFANVQKVKDLDLGDKRIRQAMLYALNRESLVQQLYQGKQPVSNSFVSTISPLYDAKIQKYTYNPAKAKQLFAAAGWTPGADGILTKNGKKFSLNFTTTAGNKIRERVQQILAAQWKAVGIDARISNQPSSVVFAEDFIQHAVDGKWDMFMFAWVQDPSFEIGNLYGEENTPSAANGYAGQNIGGWVNAQYNTLYEQQKVEFDFEKRQEDFAKMQAVWADELPTLPLYNRANPYTKVNGLANFTFTATTLYPSWNAYMIGWTQNGAQDVWKQK